MSGRIVISVTGAGLAVAVLALWWTLGGPIEFGIAWLLLVLAAIVVTRQTFLDDTRTWPPAPPKPIAAGSDVSRLAWSMNARTGIAGYVVVSRVKRVLRHRMLAHGLDLDDPADHARIDALLGDGIRSLLKRKEVTRADLEIVLDRLDEVESGSRADAQSPASDTRPPALPAAQTAPTEEN